MGNVSLPTPVALAGGALCLLGGYLVGVLAGPDPTPRTTATVVSYDPADERLCLGGDGVQEEDALDAKGRLCGTWRRADDSTAPQQGDRFRFVTLNGGSTGKGGPPATVIYGDVVP